MGATGRFRCFAAGAIALACCLAASPPAAAQSSRAESITRAEEAKAASLRPEGPTPLERVFVFVQRLPNFARTSGPYPWLGSAYLGTELAVGPAYVERFANGAALRGVAAYSTKKALLLKGRASTPEIARGLLAVHLDGRFTDAQDLSFYGLGPASRKEDPVRYNYRFTEIGPTVSVAPRPWLTCSGRYEMRTLRTEVRAPDPPAVAPGLQERLWYHVIGAEASLDWRTSPGYDTRGGLQRVALALYREGRGRPFSFEELEYEAIQLVPLLREQYVLAFRGLLTLTRAEDEGGVPVVLEPTLGGGGSLRGFATRRFTDRNRLLLTAEYRWRPARILDMAIFFDAGKVAGRARDLDLLDLETDGGIGARFHGPDFTIVDTELARSREGWRVVFTVGKEPL